MELDLHAHLGLTLILTSVSLASSLHSQSCPFYGLTLVISIDSGPHYALTVIFTIASLLCSLHSYLLLFFLLT